MTAMPLSWVPQELDQKQPVYLAIADAIELDMSCGRLQQGDKLPPQRRLAEALSVDFTTITRAYKEAAKRGLVSARVGQGTFVNGLNLQVKEVETTPINREIDMGMNMPPAPRDPALLARLHREMAEVAHKISPQALFGYQDFVGSRQERDIAAQWVRRCLPKALADQILICPGTQSALLALVTHLVKPGGVVVTEDLVYPGFRILLRQMGIEHRGLKMDDDGIIPAEFRRACEEGRVDVLYCTPTQHNPTTITWPRARRVAIAQIAREFDVKIIEDDPYSILVKEAPEPLSSLAPERGYYVAGLAKCLSSALRISFLHVPARREFQSLSLVLRSTAMMASPITKEMALHLIQSGCADLVVQSIVQAAKERQAIARRVFPKGSIQADPNGFHLWLKLGSQWHSPEFVNQLRAHSIRVIGGEVFSVTSQPVNGVRLCLGVPESPAQLEDILHTIADVLHGEPDMSNAIV